MDRDSTATKLVNDSPLCGHLTIRYDPGHIKKSLVNQMLKVFKPKTKYESFAYRLGDWFMQIYSRVKSGKKEEDITDVQEEFTKLWKHTTRHYSTEDCDPECPCQKSPASDKQDDDIHATFLADVQDAKEVKSAIGKKMMLVTDSILYLRTYF